jgi:hypothetical protein
MPAHNLIVIRPSGVWNSRAPLHNYILESRAQSKMTCALTLSIYALHYDASASPDQNRPGRRFLKRITETDVGRDAWHDYRRSFPAGPDQKQLQPTVKQLSDDALRALYDVREMSIVRRASVFEAFAQCWTLNYLAAILESGKQWSTKEGNLAFDFNPFTGKGHLPGWPRIIKSIPWLKTELSKLPHLFIHPKTRQKVDAVVSSELNAFTVIQFWRAYRNLAVHTSRLITRRFHEQYGAFYTSMMTDLAHLEPLEPGRLMPLHDDMYSAMGAAQYRAAGWMNDFLTEISLQRRGHPEAPGPKTTDFFIETPRTPPLFVDGDHVSSFQWTTDAVYRTRLSVERGWNIVT